MLFTAVKYLPDPEYKAGAYNLATPTRDTIVQ